MTCIEGEYNAVLSWSSERIFLNWRRDVIGGDCDCSYVGGFHFLF